MLQRIQSLFLLLSAAALLSLFVVPMASSAKAGIENSIFSDQVLNLQDHIGLLLACALGGILSIAAIFLFKNPPRHIYTWSCQWDTS